MFSFDQCFDTKEIAAILYSILPAIHNLHSRALYHLDIRGRNLYLNDTGQVLLGKIALYVIPKRIIFGQGVLMDIRHCGSW